VMGDSTSCTVLDNEFFVQQGMKTASCIAPMPRAKRARSPASRARSTC
jgi:hypothetical protein